MVRWMVAALALAVSAGGAENKVDKDADAAALLAMQSGTKSATALTDQHRHLAFLIGSFELLITVSIPGMSTQEYAGEAEAKWLIPDRWVGTEITGEFFGQSFQSYSIMGYDSYAKNYVASTVQSLDNALNTVRGVISDPNGKTVVMYGTIDEYLTGELNKPVKVVIEPSGSGYAMEIWDLGIGVEGAMVVKYTFKRT